MARFNRRVHEEQFTSRILPKVRTHARIYFRHVRCPDQRADRIAETVALSWKWYIQLVRRGKNPMRFPAALASYAARAVNSGRRVCGQENARDAMSPRAQRLKRFYVGKLPDISTLSENPLAEALYDNTRSPVPDQVAFRCDFPEWAATRTQRDRHMIRDMAVGERTRDLADKYHICPARVSQLRRDYHDDWARFCHFQISV